MKGDGEVKMNRPVTMPDAALEGGQATDSDVKYSIYRALQQSAQMEAQNISVQRLGGRVILRGTARTWAEREEVERAAWAAKGVFEVQNEIKIAA